MGWTKNFTLKKVENKKISEYLSEINNIEFTEAESSDIIEDIDSNIQIDNLEELLNEDIEDTLSDVELGSGSSKVQSQIIYQLKVSIQIYHLTIP